MNLYHGSNILVEHPVIRDNLRALDFGAGFYLTSSAQQAAKWAKIVTRRRKRGDATLNIYEMDERKLVSLKVMQFETSNADWLEFVVKNRKELIWGKSFDLVIGPVANDSTLLVPPGVNTSSI